MNWTELAESIIAERGNKCEFCEQPAWDLHHALVYRNTKQKKILDVKYNMILVCRKHHVHSPDAIRQAWALLVERYGRDAMVEWVEGLDLLVVPRVEWLDAD